MLTNPNSPCFWINNNLWMPLAGSALTGGQITFLEQLCGTGIGGRPRPRTRPTKGCTSLTATAPFMQEEKSWTPAHTHKQDEALYILDGQIALIAGPEKLTAGAGSFAYIPAHCVHSFCVDTAQARLLNFYLPGGFERTITEQAAPAKSRTLPRASAAPTGPSAREQALFKEIGMVWLALPDSLREEK